MATGENRGVWEVNMGKPRGGDWRGRRPQIPLPINDPPPSDCTSTPPSAQDPLFLDLHRSSNLRSSHTSPWDPCLLGTILSLKGTSPVTAGFHHTCSSEAF